MIFQYVDGGVWMQRGTLRFLAMCGVIGPIIYTLVLFNLGLFEPGYNHITQYMSELGAVDESNAWLMNVFGFIVIGILLMLFSGALDQGIIQGPGKKMGPLLVFISGLAFVLVGFFPCDPGCNNVSSIGLIHGYMAFIAQFALIGAPLFLLFRLDEDDRWRRYVLFSLIVVIVGTMLGILFRLNVFIEWVGLMQRLSFGVLFLWVEVMAIKMFRVIGRS
jgi:hypothetical membrane protein